MLSNFCIYFVLNIYIHTKQTHSHKISFIHVCIYSFVDIFFGYVVWCGCVVVVVVVAVFFSSLLSLISSFLSQNVCIHWLGLHRVLHICCVCTQWFIHIRAVTFVNVDCWTAHEHKSTMFWILFSCFSNYWWIDQIKCKIAYHSYRTRERKRKKTSESNLS